MDYINISDHFFEQPPFLCNRSVPWCDPTMATSEKTLHHFSSKGNDLIWRVVYNS